MGPPAPPPGRWVDDEPFGAPSLGYPAPLDLGPSTTPPGRWTDDDHYTGEHPPLDLGPSSVRPWDDGPDVAGFGLAPAPAPWDEDDRFAPAPDAPWGDEGDLAPPGRPWEDRVDVGSTVRPWADDEPDLLDDPTSAQPAGFYDRPWHDEDERTFALALGDMHPEDLDDVSRRRGRRRRRAVLVAAAALIAVALPVAALKSPPTEAALAVEVLPGEAGADGRVQLTGWLDEGPNGEAPEVRVEIDGRKAEQAVANGLSRQRWEWRGPRDERGFSLTLPVTSGAHRVCVIAVADGRTITCQDVSVGPKPGGSPTDPAAGPLGAEDLALPGTATSSTPPVTAETTAEVTTPSTAPVTVPPPPAPTTKAPPPPTTARPPAPTSPPGAGWQDQMLVSVNAERSKAGLRPVAMCASLTRAAQGYADLMAARNHFDHVGPDGSTLGSRTRAAGYTSAGGGWSVAENIAKGQTSVTQVMTGWMNSAGHKANLLAPGTTHIGFGKAVNGSTWWVQNFGSGGTC
jgi:uncharacterized protein YkwD